MQVILKHVVIQIYISPDKRVQRKKERNIFIYDYVQVVIHKSKIFYSFSFNNCRVFRQESEEEEK